MNMFLTLAYLFFIGSTLGWVAELLYRRFLSGANPERKWITLASAWGPMCPVRFGPLYSLSVGLHR